MTTKETFASRRRYNADSIRFVNSLLAYVAPLILIVFLLYPYGVIESTRYDPLGYCLMSIATALVGILSLLRLLFKKPTSKWYELAVLLSIISAGAMMIMFVTGFQHPVVMFWLLAIIYAYLNFGNAGYASMSLVTVAVGIADLMFEPDLTSGLQYTILTVMYIAVLNIVGFFMVRVVNLTATSQRRLIEVRNRELTQRDRMQAVLNNMAEGLLAVTDKGQITLQNGSALGILDTNQSLVGRKLDTILHLTDGNNQPVHAIDLLGETHKIIFRDDLVHHFSQDDTINMSMLVTPIRAGYGQRGISSGYVIILRDITKQKSLDEERDEFISVVSHELRTPIAVAEGSLGNLVFLQSRGADQKTINDAAKTAHEQVLFLSNMVNDLGTLSRAERGVGDTKEVININQLADSMFNKYQSHATAKNLVLKIDVQRNLPTVTQSRLYLEETLQNFITNAIKYTREGSVTLHATLVPEGVELAVSDTGIGISTSDQKRVYEKFFRSEDYRTRENGGTGLGLYVTKKLIDKMGVEIHLTSKLNKGSRFSIVLPTDK